MQELPLRCKNCKALINPEDLTEVGIYKIPAYQGTAYLRYICSFCREFGEASFNMDKMEDVARVSRKKKPEKPKGQITIDEIIQFHTELEKLKNSDFLKDL